MDWYFDRRKVKDLTEWEGNPRRITKKGLSNLKDSIERFGIAEPLSITSDGIIIGGHGRKKALESLGIKEVDCYVLEKTFSEFEDYKELNVRLNKNIAGEWDMDMLANDYELSDLEEWGFEDFDFALDGEGNHEPEKKEEKEKEVEYCPHCGEEL